MDIINKTLTLIRKSIQGNAASRNQQVLLQKWTKQGKYLEIGVWKGDFSNSILEICNPEELHLLDPWLFQPTFKNRMFGGSVAKNQKEMDEIFENVKLRFSKYKNITYHRGFSADLHANFSDGFFDAIYIDGNHYYEYVYADLNNYWSKVKTGGLITGDDYGWTAEDIQGQQPVKDAVAKFLGEKKGFVSFEALIGDQFVIRRIG
jgi:hypothetical protein